ncbi:unnamed protein product [Closterium sp. Yama58-4]|nr:unnamed protein product [Closterium sp. Yama58-4]
MEYNMNAFGMTSAFVAPVASYPNAWQSPQSISSIPASNDLNLPTWLVDEPEAPASESDEGSIAEWVAQSCIADDDDSDSSDASSDIASRHSYSNPNGHYAAPHHPDAMTYHSRALGMAHSHSSASIASHSNRGSSPSSSLSSSPSVSRTSSLSSRLWSQSSVSTTSSTSSLTSPPRSGSPTSVLGQNANAEAWELLFAAAGRIQELALEPEPPKPACAGPPRAGAQPYVPASRHMHQAPAYGAPQMNHNGNRQHANHHQAAQQQGNNRRAGPQPHRRNNHNGAQVAKGSPLRRVSECETDSRKGQALGNGTGVFLPRAAPAPASAKPSADTSNAGRKSQRPGATVYLPARLVHVFGLDVDENNNVLLNRAAPGGAAPASGPAAAKPAAPGPKRGAGCAGARAAPVIKLAPEEMLAGSGRKGGKGGRSRARAAAAAGVAAPAVNLPSDWTY